MARIMGIINLTPDSFFRGSRYLGGDGNPDTGRICDTVARMLDSGADIVDFGAVSSRPGADAVDIAEERRRLIPAIKEISARFPKLLFSVDTTRTDIVKEVYDIAGPFIVNDISAGEDDSEMLPLVGELSLQYIAMHRRGTPETMQNLTFYPEGVVAAVNAYFGDFCRRAEDCGISDWILDPGFGFAKTVEQNYELLEALGEFKHFGKPILVGISRKSMVYAPFSGSPDDCLEHTRALHLKALESGADILRVHDVADAALTLKNHKGPDCKSAEFADQKQEMCPDGRSLVES